MELRTAYVHTESRDTVEVPTNEELQALIDELRDAVRELAATIEIVQRQINAQYSAKSER